MVDRFVPCVSCARHIKTGDAACPFCGAATPETTATASALTNPLSRAAVLFVGLTTAAACGGETNSPPSPTSATSSSGTTNTSSSSGESSSSSGTVPEPTAVPMYGPAPQPTHTTSGAVPAYGAAPVDAGKL